MFNKINLFLLLIFACTNAVGNIAKKPVLNDIHLQWLGVAGIHLTDGKHSLFFDPIITRPSPTSFINFKGIKSDQKAVNSWLSKFEVKKSEAVFISHTHFDHALDAVSFAQKTNAKLWGPPSILKICEGQGYLNQCNSTISIKKPIKLGDYSITPIESQHGKILDMFYFARGKIQKPINKNSNIYQYKALQNYSYYVKHPNLSIVFWPGSRQKNEISFFQKNKVPTDILILGIANRLSNQNLYDISILTTEPKVVIPVHWDNFFLERGKKEVKKLWGVKIEEFKKFVHKKNPKIKFIIPEYDTPINISQLVKNK